jgi:hypothetical protein
LLEGLLAQAHTLQFGSSSEKFSANEQELLFNEPEEHYDIEPQLGYPCA